MPLMTKVEARRVAPSSLEFPVSCKALEYWEQATGGLQSVDEGWWKAAVVSARCKG